MLLKIKATHHTGLSGFLLQSFPGYAHTFQSMFLFDVMGTMIPKLQVLIVGGTVAVSSAH